MSRTRVLPVVAALTLFASVASAQRLCGRDADCPGDEICEKGVCVLPGALVPATPTPPVQPSPVVVPPTPVVQPAPVQPSPVVVPPTPVVQPSPAPQVQPPVQPPPTQPAPAMTGPLPPAPLPPPVAAPPPSGPLEPAPVVTPPAPTAVPLPAKERAQVAAVATAAPPRDPPAFAWSALLFGDVTPSSSRLVPFSAAHEMGVLAGVMVGAGLLLPGIVRVMALARGGYGAAGRGPGKGDDGVFLGGGLLVSLALLPEMDVFQRLEPFVRLHLDGRVAQTSDTSNGALGTNPFSVAVGIMAANGFGDLHATFGGDVAGGVSVGFGLSFGYAR